MGQNAKDADHTCVKCFPSQSYINVGQGGFNDLSDGLNNKVNGTD